MVRPIGHDCCMSKMESKDGKLVSQYLQDKKIVQICDVLHLYNKYKSDYQINDILFW